MSDLLQNESAGQSSHEKSRSGLFRFFAVFAVFVICAAIYFAFTYEGAKHIVEKGSQSHLALGPDEKAYVSQLQLENITLSKAENFLHQEVVTVSGEIVNSGNRPVGALELAVEFSDELHQIVLRETSLVVAPSAPPLAPAERRPFEISFERIPTSWNMQQPAIRITGMQFVLSKE